MSQDAHRHTEPLRRVPPEMFRFATHDELYLTVMQVFGEANERLVTALTFDRRSGPAVAARPARPRDVRPAAAAPWARPGRLAARRSHPAGGDRRPADGNRAGR